jgi:oligopeptide/dipeptide ABC transporter ATP-binding protein
VATSSEAPILSVEGLSVAFRTERGAVRAVDDVSFSIFPGETLGIVGESGCGKSVTALSILRLLPTPPAQIENGSLRFGGRDLRTLSERELEAVRGDEIAMVFQEPMTSLNPVHTVGAQIVEAIRLHRPDSRREARARAISLLERVGIRDASEVIDAFPHELSGGMRQRVMIAMALSCEPKLLLADEPTTALDVTIQAQILDLLQSLRRSSHMAILLITHDLSVVEHHTDRVLVMYAGEVVESASVGDLFRRPAHPYTRALLASMPRLGGGKRRTRLPTIEGVVPGLGNLPKGCRFQERCGAVIDACRAERIPLTSFGPVEENRMVRCLRAEELAS